MVNKMLSPAVKTCFLLKRACVLRPLVALVSRMTGCGPVNLSQGCVTPQYACASKVPADVVGNRDEFWVKLCSL